MCIFSSFTHGSENLGEIRHEFGGNIRMLVFNHLNCNVVHFWLGLGYFLFELCPRGRCESPNGARAGRSSLSEAFGLREWDSAKFVSEENENL